MRSAVSNLLIAATMAMIVTGVVVLTTGPVSTDGDDATRIESTTGAQAPAAQPAAAQTAVASAAAAPAQDDATPDTPSYLDPEPIDETPEAQVLGVTQSQESEPDLADTGPVDVGMWVVAACTMIALGITVACAARDHAAGRLTLLP